MTLIPYFEEINFENFPREENQLADALATMSSMFKVKWDNEAPQITIERMDEPTYCYEVDTEEVVDKLGSMKLKDISRPKNILREIQSTIRSKKVLC